MEVGELLKRAFLWRLIHRTLRSIAICAHAAHSRQTPRTFRESWLSSPTARIRYLPVRAQGIGTPKFASGGGFLRKGLPGGCGTPVTTARAKG